MCHAEASKRSSVAFGDAPCHPEVSKGGLAWRGLLAVTLILLSACSSTNTHEQLADALTRAVVANDLSPVMNRLSPRIEGELTRVRVAEFSDELNAQGAYQGVKQTKASWCPKNALCFDAQFQGAPFHEVMKLSKNGKVTYWWIRAAQKQS